MWKRDQDLTPNEVFTPTQLPLSKHHAYAHRTDAEAKLKRFLRRNQVPVVFGEYGVGKTTIVRRLIKELGFEENLVYVPTTAGKSMSDVLKVALEQLGFFVEVEQTTTDSKNAHFGAKLVFEGDFEEGKTSSTTSRAAVDSPTDARIVRLLRERQVTLVIDELHRASPEFKSDIADLIKSTHGQESNFPQIVLIGTTFDSSELVAIDPGIDRFVKELRISPMTETESREVVESGFAKLKIDIPEDLVEKISVTTSGAPSLIQSICLDIAETAFARTPKAAEMPDYNKAVQLYLEEHGNRLAGMYNSAIEHTGSRRYKKQILTSMSLIDAEFFELEEVRAHIEERTGWEVDRTALSGPLRDLKNGEDAVLQDVTRRDGNRVHNLSAFLDPMMKSFIRFMNELESQGALPE